MLWAWIAVVVCVCIYVFVCMGMLAIVRESGCDREGERQRE